MSQEIFEQLMRTVEQQMALHLLELATGDESPKKCLTRDSGGLRHLRITDGKGTVLLQVSGKDTGGLAFQYVLACLHKMSIEQLKALHKRPLKRALEVTTRKG